MRIMVKPGVKISQVVTRTGGKGDIANLDVVVIPSEILVGLQSGEELCFGNVEDDGSHYKQTDISDQRYLSGTRLGYIDEDTGVTGGPPLTETSGDQVHGVMMRQIHGRPPNPQRIGDEKGS